MIRLKDWMTYGWEEAIRGMRNPLNSWDKSDSKIYDSGVFEFEIGPNDLALMKKLYKDGPDHRKFMRMITVYVDITAPLYWWKEFDTYKVGTVANSCSTMHTIHKKEFTLDDFSCEKLNNYNAAKNDDEAKEPFIAYGWFKHHFEKTIKQLNRARELYLQYNEKDPAVGRELWYQMIQLLPSSYNQKRTVMLNYEVLANIYKSRKNHKLDEWHVFCDWIKALPYSELITGEESDEG